MSTALEPFLISTGLVAVAEIGDKTQLLALLLAARFRKPVPIILGILAATVANHLLAAAAGVAAAAFLQGPWMRWVLGGAFLAFAAWALIPDKFEEGEAGPKVRAGSVFLTTLVAFFFVEMGDKTQVATVMLAARYDAWAWVVAGTTLGMMLANAPVVWFGDRVTRMVPIRVVHLVSAAIFMGLGVAALVNWG